MARKGDADLDTGVKDLDSEHDLMIGLIRALDKAVANSPRPQVEALLQQLAEFARVHFATEEIMMRLYAYPEFGRHQLEHAKLLDQIDEVRAEFASGNVQPTRSLATAMQHWFAEHVRTLDAALAHHVRETQAEAR